MLKEQGLATSGAVDPTSAAKVGKLLGVKYIILGGIDKFAINNTKGGIGAFGVGGNLVQANATINLRFVDTTTAERVISISSDGEVKKGGGFLKGTSLSRDAEWGVASETVQKTAKAVVAKLTAGDYLARVSSAAAPGALEGKVIKVDGNRAYINLGASSGVKLGDAFNIINVGEALIDPDSGKKLGADEKQIGSGAVTEVQAEFAVITFTGKAAAKDTDPQEVVPLLRLRAVAGARRGQEFMFSGPRVRIGRSRDNDLILPERDAPLSSSHHAEVLLDSAGTWSVIDLGSSNGTRVNDVAVQRHALEPGDRLTFGHEQFVVSIGRPARAWLWMLLVTGVVLFLLAGVLIERYRTRTPFEDVATSAATSVFVVVVEDAGARSIVGTAFVVAADGLLATNAHVADALQKRGNRSPGGSVSQALAVQSDSCTVRVP